MQQPQIENLGSSREYVSGMVSVVIPTYNQVGFVKETIDSVLAQDYPFLQIIITDDGSTDGTAKIIQDYAQQYPEKVGAVTSVINTGIPANFNRGFQQVKGEYIAWLGGDDLMLPEKITKQVKIMQERPDAVGCCHDAEVFQSQDGKLIGLFSELMNGRLEFKEGGVELWFAQNYFMLPSTVMIRSAAAPQHGFDERLKYQNDWLFDVEVFRQGKCVPLNEVLGRYRRHENNVTGNFSLLNTGHEEVMISLAIIESRYPELYRYVNKRRKQMYLSLAVKSFRNGNSRSARYYLLAAIRNGLVLKGVVVFIALMLFGQYVLKQLSLPTYSKSSIFVKLTRIFWHA
ncbi:WcaA Glycosyltransferases involved in cell wall biogenesis [Methylophilaceae bacterium]